MKKEILYVRNLVAYRNEYILNNISFLAFQGEVLALVGGHGAGVSALLNILAGKSRSDEGAIFLEGKRMSFASVGEANQAGIYRIDRESLIVDKLDVADNIVLTYPSILPGFFVSKQAVRKKAGEIMDAYGISIELTKKAYMLDEFERAAISIIKVAMHNARVLILSGAEHYNEHQRSAMQQLISRITAQGISVIISATDADKVMDIADRIIVFNKGRIEGSFLHEEFNAKLIHMLMMPQIPKLQRIHLPAEPGDVRLKLRDIVIDGGKIPDLELRGGEIVSFLDRFGQTDKRLIDVLSGVADYSGQIWLDGKLINIRSERDARNNRIAYIPMYNAPGILHDSLSLEDNFLLLNPKAYTRWGLINRRLQKFACRQYLKKSSVPMSMLGFRPDVLHAHYRNEINLIMLRALKPRVILLDDPFINSDTTMKAQIYAFLEEAVHSGVCIIAGLLSEGEQRSLKVRSIPLY